MSSVNGHEVRNMRDLVKLIEATTGDFVELQVDVNGLDKLSVVIDRKRAELIQPKLLEDHNIMFDRSPDLAH